MFQQLSDYVTSSRPTIVVIAVAVKEKVTEKRKRKEEVGRSDTSRKEMNGCGRSNTGKGEEV